MGGTSPWKVEVWSKPVRDAQRNIVKQGFWHPLGEARSTEAAIQAVQETVAKSRSVARATRTAPIGEPIEIYGSVHSFCIKRFVSTDEAQPGTTEEEPSEGL